jgi:NAD+ synthase
MRIVRRGTVSRKLAREELDALAEVRRIAAALQLQTGRTLRRDGLVVAMSGGVDSSVCAALAVTAVGPRHVLGLGLPDRESDAQGLVLARDWAARLGIEFLVEDITPTLTACGCYRRRDAARELAEIVAATNFKQRIRTMLAYYHADRLNYAVVGTANRLEHDQGFFVKGGDGLADVKPIAHLYKSEVYQLAESLGVPAAIRERTPTTDTYSLPQARDEVSSTLPLGALDQVLRARNEGRKPADVARELGYPSEQIARAYREVEHKRRVTRPLHLTSLLVERVEAAAREQEKGGSS